MNRHLFFWALVLLTFAFALWRGRSDEKLAGGICLAATVATRFAVSPLTARYTGVEFGLLAVDLAVLGAFVAIALRSQRFWPLWIAGLQLTNSMAHLMKAVDFALIPRAYAAAAAFWSYPILFIILIGTWRQHKRRLRESAGTLIA